MQNNSLVVPPTGTAVLGSKESMHEYQNWLDECSFRIMHYSNLLVSVFGLKKIDWHLVSSAPVIVTVEPTVPVPVITTISAIRTRPGLTTIGTISGQSGGKSATVMVPSGYWELWYAAEPIVTGGQYSHSARGTNSAVFPALSIKRENYALLKQE